MKILRGISTAAIASVMLAVSAVPARAVEQIDGKLYMVIAGRQPVSHPNWRLIAGVFGVLLTSMALAIYGLAASPYAPFPGGAIGQELAEGLDAVLGAWSIYPSRVSEQLIAVALALIGLTLALISAAWLHASLAAIWRGLQNLRYTRQAIQAISGLFARASWAAPLQRVGKILRLRRQPVSDVEAAADERADVMPATPSPAAPLAGVMVEVHWFKA